MSFKNDSWSETVIARRELKNSKFEISISRLAVNLKTIMIKNK